MRAPSEAVPLNELNQPYPYEWMRRGRVQLGNDPGAFTQILPWAAIFAESPTTLGTARVELRNLEVHVLSKRTGMWTRLQSGPQVWGQYYSMDIINGQAFAPLEIARGNDSVQIRVDKRYMSHFWPQTGRWPISPGDIAGVYASGEARMDAADYAAGARYVMDVGVDYWLDASSSWNNFKTNGGAGVGRLKLLTPRWRKFYMTTVKPVFLQLCSG